VSISPFLTGRGAHAVRALVMRTLAAVCLAVGYLDLVRGGLTLAPVLLVAGYVVFVPLALLAD
jgi:hypothetical protein